VAPNVAAGIPQALVFAGFGQWCRKRPLAPYWLCWRMMGVSDDGAGWPRKTEMIWQRSSAPGGNIGRSMVMVVALGLALSRPMPVTDRQPGVDNQPRRLAERF
jgi:hypothetical protein